MKNQEFADKIKEDISKIYDVSKWTFFFNSRGNLEFYKTNPAENWIYTNSFFHEYEENIKCIAERLGGHYRLKTKNNGVIQ